MLTSACIQAVQKSLLDKLYIINSSMRSHITNKKRRNFKMRKHWRQYCRINSDIIQLSLLIGEYSRYLKPYLSILYPYIIGVQCYLLYIILFDAAVHQYFKYLFMNAVAGLELVLFGLTRQCAAVVRNNTALEFQNRVFCFRLFVLLNKNRRSEAVRRVNAIKLLKAEAFQANKRLQRFSFKLIGNHRITSNSFSLVCFNKIATGMY